MSHQRRGQNLAPRTGRMLAVLKRPSRRWTPDELAQMTQDAIVSEYGHGRAAANDLSRATDIPVETCRNIIEGRNAPSLANFFTLLDAVPALRAQMRNLLDMHGGVESERFMHEAIALFQRYTQRGP
jgi:hypothetical protein